MKPVVIVGAGPAGISAARTLFDHGVTPCLVDESLRGGGQIYRRQPPGFQRTARQIYGFEAGKAEAVHRTLDELAPLIDYRPETLVWNAEDRRLDLLSNGHAASVEYSRIIVATGATDRILPVPGWTLPGVYSLGAAQIALKYQGCAIGERVAFCGSGPLLYLVAYQYAKAGADVVAVLDSAPFSAQCHALPALLGQPATLAKGLYLPRLAHGPRRSRASGRDAAADRRRTTGQRHTVGADHTLACDAVAFAHALRSETQLADLLGCEFAWNALNRAWLPQRDCAGRSSVDGVYLAGDGAGIMGADAAQMAGERAALAVLEDAGVAIDHQRPALLERRLARIQRFRQGLETAFSLPGRLGRAGAGRLDAVSL